MIRRLLLALPCLLVAAAADASHLLFAGAVLNGSNGVAGMGRPADVAISPDGRFLYATGTTDDSVLRFARDPATGALTFLDRVIGDTATPPGPIPHLDLPEALSLSPDGAQLYVAGGTHSAGTSAVTWFERDATTGALTYRGSVVDDSEAGGYYLDTPLDVLVSRDGASVYVTAFEARAVTVFARAPGTGDLSLLQVVVDDVGGVDGLEGIQRVTESPDGSTLYVASASRPTTVPGPGGIAVFARAGDGTLTFLEVKQQGVGGVDGLGAPRDVAVSPDGKSVYVAAGGKLANSAPFAAGVARFDRAPDGRLTFAGSIPESAFGYGEPRSIVVAADGTSVYAVLYGVNIGVSTNTTPAKLIVFDRDPVTGAITVADRFDDKADGVLGLAGSLRARLAPDGRFVYVAAELDPSSPPPGTSSGALAIFSLAPPGPACSNGVDDDGDGRIDFPDDPQCSSPDDPSERPDCRNGIDDDGDGLIDWPSDPQCTGASDPSELVDCMNGIDDDGDGLVDADDPGCSNPLAPDRENPQCSDGIDNDGDGMIDFDGGASANHGVALAPPDPQCTKPYRNSEAPTGCGTGAELVVLVGALRWLRTRNPNAVQSAVL
jgi:DNA-binding beta-propeller fold protein YncE